MRLSLHQRVLCKKGAGRLGFPQKHWVLGGDRSSRQPDLRKYSELIPCVRLNSKHLQTKKPIILS